MTLFILDTDSVSLFLAGNQKLIQRVTQDVPHVVTTIVAVLELFNGCDRYQLSGIIDRDAVGSIEAGGLSLCPTKNILCVSVTSHGKH